MKILIFGDSHSMYFNLTNELKDMCESFRGIKTKVVTIPGATINGFGKRKSTLNLRDKFIKELNDFSPNFVCFALGQVDVELGLYFRKVVKGEFIEDKSFIDELCDNYLLTIKDVLRDSNIPLNKVCVKGINLSVLTKSRHKAVTYTKRIITENIQEEEAKKFLDILQKTYPSNLERYSNHIYFNSVMKGKTDGICSYFDINDLIEDPDVKGEVHPMYIPSSSDHHILDSLLIRKIHTERLISNLLGI